MSLRKDDHGSKWEGMGLGQVGFRKSAGYTHKLVQHLADSVSRMIIEQLNERGQIGVSRSVAAA